MSSETHPRVVAIASGKGGTGKSLVAANVGVFLATLGRKVVVVDVALGNPNLHIFAGVPRPGRTLSEALCPDGAQLGELAVSTPVPGLRLIGAAADPPSISRPSHEQCAQLITGIRALDADWVVLDLGSGTDPAVLELFLAADVRVLSAVPDPTSIELVHRFLRAAFLARLDQVGLGDMARLPPGELRACQGGIPSALELYLRAEGAMDSRLPLLRSAIVGLRVHLLVNAVRSKSDMELGRAVALAARRRLGLPVQYLGHLEYDEAVWASTRRRRPLLVEHPETRVSKCFERVARGLMAVRDPATADEVAPDENHYELLDGAPTASFEDIRRANRRVRDLYGAESIAISGLYDPATLEAFHRRLDVAYTTLMDAAKRKEYDQGLFPEGIPQPHPAPEVGRAARTPSHHDLPLAVRPAMPELHPGTIYSGALLRQIREAIGVELREIAERSKISLSYLQAIEDDQFARLPAAVYLRGFLVEYARQLDLDPDAVKESYLARAHNARARR
jgi:flagellar biosynthesis protein FlhG